MIEHPLPTSNQTVTKSLTSDSKMESLSEQSYLLLIQPKQSRPKLIKRQSRTKERQDIVVVYTTYHIVNLTWENKLLTFLYIEINLKINFYHILG